MKTIENLTLDAERALYASENLTVKNCRFDGPADGESALKECKNIKTEGCFFNLRYPFWHCTNADITDCHLTQLCRAALWYSENISVKHSRLHGIKALRECKNIKMENCHIISPEFGWSAEKITVKNTFAESEYFMLRARDCLFDSIELKGKYSFQYVENAAFENCSFDTKDAFWHGKNITLKNCTLKGEYLAWYSENLTLIGCTVTGTQPFCYCKKLRLIGCRMVDTDLAFEKSEVDAVLTEPVISIKNPLSGEIRVPYAGEIIMDDEKAKGKVICLSANAL